MFTLVSLYFSLLFLSCQHEVDYGVDCRLALESLFGTLDAYFLCSTLSEDRFCYIYAFASIIQMYVSFSNIKLIVVEIIML